MSTGISRVEKYISVQIPNMDAVVVKLLQRVRDLLATRADMPRPEFGRAIKRSTPSWLSEFFAGKRTTNDLRLVIRMARVLRVPVSHLLNESEDAPDATTMSLMGAWKDLGPKQRQTVLRLALDLQDTDGTDTQGSSAASSAEPAAGSRTDDSREKHQGKKRR